MTIRHLWFALDSQIFGQQHNWKQRWDHSSCNTCQYVDVLTHDPCSHCYTVTWSCEYTWVGEPPSLKIGHHFQLHTCKVSWILHGCDAMLLKSVHRQTDRYTERQTDRQIKTCPRTQNGFVVVPLTEDVSRTICHNDTHMHAHRHSQGTNCTSCANEAGKHTHKFMQLSESHWKFCFMCSFFSCDSLEWPRQEASYPPRRSTPWQREHTTVTIVLHLTTNSLQIKEKLYMIGVYTISDNVR